MRAEWCSYFTTGRRRNRETNMSTLQSEVQCKEQHSTREKLGLTIFLNFRWLCNHCSTLPQSLHHSPPLHSSLCPCTGRKKYLSKAKSSFPGINFRGCLRSQEKGVFLCAASLQLGPHLQEWWGESIQSKARPQERMLWGCGGTSIRKDSPPSAETGGLGCYWEQTDAVVQGNLFSLSPLLHPMG